MATSRNILCGICEAQDITKHADQWCRECDEAMCSDCENHHKISKSSRNHGVISIDNYHKLPPSISEIGNHCEYHDMKYTNFCQFHDRPCCPDCISTNHNDCIGLLSIREIIKTSKTSALIDTIEQSLTDIKTNIDKITKNRQQNMSEIRQQRQMFQDQIKDIRVKINLHLDTLKQNILQELDDTEDKIKSQIDNLLKQLSQNSKRVEGLQRDIRAVKEYASDLQTFLGSKAIAKEVDNEEEEYLMALSEDGCLQQLNLGYNINTKIKDILSTITTFGSVSIETSPPSVVIKTMKAKQAQIIQHPSVKSIKDIKLTLHATFNIPNRKCDIFITGCIVCPNGKMIFVDYNNSRLVILNHDGTLDKEISCSLSYPLDVTCVDDTTVAVSTYNGIEIININSTKKERRIRTCQPCGGITYHNGVLLWCEYQIGIQVMELHVSDDRATTLVKQSNLPYGSYITTCGDNIYQTNRDTKIVTCYTIKGEQLWEFKDPLLLNGQLGVTVDNNFNVYVTSGKSKQVVVLAPDGRQMRQLIDSDDRLDCPTGISFDIPKNRLLVTNYHGSAFLYHMR